MKMKKNGRHTSIKMIALLPLLLIATQTLPFNLKPGHAVIQLGGFVSSAGTAQNIELGNSTDNIIKYSTTLIQAVTMPILWCTQLHFK